MVIVLLLLLRYLFLDISPIYPTMSNQGNKLFLRTLRNALRLYLQTHTESLYRMVVN
jgi:hypothetical protein